jgi:hypothetical protein
MPAADVHRRSANESSQEKTMNRALFALALMIPAFAWAAPADLIRGLPPGGTWNQEVRKVIGALYDTNGNGLLDTDAEIDAVECGIWKAVDEGVRRDWRGSSVVSVYGFTAGAFWSGGELGIPEAERDHARAAMERCGIQPAEGAPSGNNAVSLQGPAPLFSATGRDISAEIKAIPATDTTAWGTAAGKAFLAAYDANHSGGIELNEELGSVPCETWSALDAGTSAGWSGTGLRVIYGFDDGLIWVGDTFGIDARLRSAAVIATAACGIGDPITEPGPLIQGLPDGGQDPWDAFVRRAVLQAHDADKSGAIDREGELSAIACSTWKSMDDGVRAGWNSGIRQVYGLAPDLTWVGQAVGIDESLRAQSDAAAARCGLLGPGEDGAIIGTGAVIDGIHRASAAEEFDAAVATVLLQNYDADGSGAINTAKEVKQIPCAVWGTLDQEVQAAWGGTGVRTIYGFGKQYIWVGYALGFDEKVRKKADAAMAKCE